MSSCVDRIMILPAASRSSQRLVIVSVKGFNGCCSCICHRRRGAAMAVSLPASQEGSSTGKHVCEAVLASECISAVHGREEILSC